MLSARSPEGAIGVTMIQMIAFEISLTNTKKTVVPSSVRCGPLRYTEAIYKAQQLWVASSHCFILMFWRLHEKS